jgi:hypothetical protein
MGTADGPDPIFISGADLTLDEDTVSVAAADEADVIAFYAASPVATGPALNAGTLAYSGSAFGWFVDPHMINATDFTDGSSVTLGTFAVMGGRSLAESTTPVAVTYGSAENIQPMATVVSQGAPTRNFVGLPGSLSELIASTGVMDSEPTVLLARGGPPHFSMINSILSTVTIQEPGGGAAGLAPPSPAAPHAQLAFEVSFERGFAYLQGCEPFNPDMVLRLFWVDVDGASFEVPLQGAFFSDCSGLSFARLHFVPADAAADDRSAYLILSSTAMDAVAFELHTTTATSGARFESGARLTLGGLRDPMWAARDSTRAGTPPLVCAVEQPSATINRLSCQTLTQTIAVP